MPLLRDLPDCERVYRNGKDELELDIICIGILGTVTCCASSPCRRECQEESPGWVLEECHGRD